MPLFFIISVTGWTAVIALGFTTALPYLLRSTSNSTGRRDSRSFRKRMQPHFVIGYAITGLSLAHAWASMSRAGALRENMFGLLAGTMCLLLVILQVLIGLSLQNPETPGRWALRRTHFWVMVACAGTLLFHLWQV
ncbi:MAG: hypothetical protein ACRD2U_15280 [Terriglobales bacterium]